MSRSKVFLAPRTFFVLSVACAFYTPSVHAESLQEAVLTALSYHPTVESAQARLQTAEEQRKAQASGYFPEISMNTAAGREYANNTTTRGLTTSRGAGYSNLWEGTVSAREMIFDGMETQSRVRAAHAGEKSAEMGLEDVQENLAMRMVQTYVGLMRARGGLSMLAEQEKSVKNYLSRIQTMVKDGAADEAELQQARDVLAVLENYKADYEGQVRAMETDYLELTGHLPEGHMSMPVLDKTLIPQNVNMAVELALREHPALRGAGFDAQAAKQNVRAEKGTLYPDINGELSYAEVDKRDVIGGESTDGKALVRMSWNLETGGGQLARIREKTYQEKQAQSRVRELGRGIERAVRQAFSGYETARAQLKIQDERVDLNARLLDTYKTQFEAAKISVLQLMQSDNQLLLTKLEEMNTQNRVLLAQYGILASMGQLRKSLKSAPAFAAVAPPKVEKLALKKTTAPEAPRHKPKKK